MSQHLLCLFKTVSKASLMEGLLKQIRKFSGKEESSSFREENTLPQRTPPSKQGEGKPQKWFKRQLSRQMSFTHSIEEAEYAAAVAAAAFAITAVDSDNVARRKPESGHRPSLSRIIGGLINPELSAEHGERPKHYADENDDDATRMVPKKTIHPVPSKKMNLTTPKKGLTFADESDDDPGNPSVYGTPLSGEEEWEEAKRMKPTAAPYYTAPPTVKKTPSFDEEELEKARRVKPNNTPFFKTPTLKNTPSFEEERMEETREMKSPKRPALQPAFPPHIPPPPAIPPLIIQPIASPKREQRPTSQENDADGWERKEMDKIKRRYENLNATILEWEDKKKKKAKRKLEMTEKGPEKKRAKAMNNYQLEMEQIKQIVDGAMAQAKDKYRNEELKTREKASIYRATGESPLSPTCLCL